MNFNDRSVEKISRSAKPFYSVGRTDKFFVDKGNDKILVRYTDFFIGAGMASIHSGGSLEAWRKFFAFFWIENRRCEINSGLSEKIL